MKLFLNLICFVDTTYLLEIKLISLFLIFFTALYAAIPFRSEPEDAAVAEVLAILLVSVSVILILSKLIPNSCVITPRTFVCRP